MSLPKTGKKRKTTHGKHDLSPDFSPRRIEEFPNQCLCEDPPESGNLFCSCCRTNISNKKSCVVVHISSELHLKNRREYEECKRESKTIAQFIIENDKNLQEVQRSSATVIANNVPARYQQLMQQTCNLATAARDKFNQMFVNQGGKSLNIMQIYKGFSMLNPVSLRNKTQEQRLEAINNIVTLVPACRLMNENNLMRNRLIAELDELNNRANLINIDDDDENVVGDGPSLLLWWRNNGDALPDWKIVLHYAVLFQPSSATAERIFSMIDWMFGHLQEAALEDYKETSLILRYNTIWRSKYD